MAPGDLRRKLLADAPALGRRTGELCESWLSGLIEKIDSGEELEFRPKQVNDPIWGTVELLPWEVALLDTPLLQRLRGVRQLGLAHLVFPGACHGRLEHTIGVIGAAERAIGALERQIDRWNRSNKSRTIPKIDADEHFGIRLAALFHDVGHGPFSHALEPVMDVKAPLVTNSSTDEMNGTEEDWRTDLLTAGNLLKDTYALDDKPAISEIDQPPPRGPV